MENLPKGPMDIQEKQPLSPLKEPESTEQNNWWKIGFLVTATLFLATVGVFGFYILKTRKEERLPAPTPMTTFAPFPTPILIPTVFPVLTPDSITDWKTYIDPNNMFMLKYPTGFYETKSHAPELKNMRDAGALSTVQPWNEVRRENDMLIRFFIATKRPAETLLELLAWVANRTVEQIKDGTIETKEIVIDGRRSFWWEGASMSVPYIYVSIPKDESTSVIVEANGEFDVSAKQKELLEKILSTFKFLE